MTEQEFWQSISLGRESSFFEVKRPGPMTEPRLRMQVVRAMLGLVNRRDGGHVIIGVDDVDSDLHPRGLTHEDAASWTFDKLADCVRAYAEPMIDFDLEVLETKGKFFVIVSILEFDTVPVLCRKSYDTILHVGQCYLRSRVKPETRPVSTYEDMRDLIERATEKGIRHLWKRMENLGVAERFVESSSTADFEKYEAELGELR